ncbi:MAG: hypothetical protein MJ207_02245 [Bacilli bacterium]|nr:hypothetical protein [Bacilli bacterium]
MIIFKAMKKYFFGKYYKFVSENGFSFAVIISSSDDGPELQVITNDGAHVINDKESVKVIDNKVNFKIKQEDMSLEGIISLGELHPLRKRVMGPFSILPLECKHEIYSMYHTLEGSVIYNNKQYSFNHGVGYIEGDRGVNFPKKYVWYNSVINHQTVTLAIATIPIMFFKFIGVLCFIKNNNHEYYLSTYNLVKLKKVSPTEIILKKGKYVFTLKVLGSGGHLLKAPTKGRMSRYIKENLKVKTSYTLQKKNETILDVVDDNSSLEYMFD